MCWFTLVAALNFFAQMRHQMSGDTGHGQFDVEASSILAAQSNKSAALPLCTLQTSRSRSSIISDCWFRLSTRVRGCQVEFENTSYDQTHLIPNRHVSSRVQLNSEDTLFLVAGNDPLLHDSREDSEEDSNVRLFSQVTLLLRP